MTTPQTSLPFMPYNSWKIELSKIPKYPDFTGDFIEPLDYHLLNLIHKTDDTHITEEIKALLDTAILSKINKATGELTVKHNQRHNIGRFYGDADTTLIPHSRYVKHTMFHYLGWLDVDMVKAHPTIAVKMGERVGLKLPEFENYINNFDKIAEELIRYYDVEGQKNPIDNDDIKKLFVMMLYGGGFERWVADLQEDTEKKRRRGYVPKKIQNADISHPIAAEFKKDCVKVGDMIYKTNPALSKKLKKEDDESFNTKSRVSSYWFQIIENHLLHIAYQFFVNKRIITPKRCGLEYDGLNIPPTNIQFDKNAIIDELNQLVELTTGLSVKFKFKGYNSSWIMQPIIELRNNMIIETVEVNTPTNTSNAEDASNKEDSEKVFQRIYPEFELTHAKIKNRGCYVKELDDEVIVFSKSMLVNAYEHIECGFSRQGNPVLFINNWMQFNNKIRIYDDMDIFPDNTRCPDNVFNLWRPFQIDLFKGDYTPNPEAVKTVFNHIKVLCNHQEEVYEYILLWIAHMLQYPAKKSIVPTFISKQGAGKGTLMKLLGKLLGEKRILETTTPSRDVWGNFNGMMPTKFLINLNELSRKETTESEGRIKALITDPTLTINSKGVNQYEIQSYHRFIITTNNEQPVATSDDDRRNLIIRCSDELLQKSDYFVKMHGLLEDDEVIRSVGDAFKAMEVKQNFNEYAIPKTKYQNDLKEASRPYYELWLSSFVAENCKQEEVQLYPNEMFASFKFWCERNGYNIEKMNSTCLGVRVNNLFPPTNRDKYLITANNGKHRKTLFIPALIEFFKIETLDTA